MSPHEFIDALIPISKGRIPQSFVIAQAALESRWGNSQLALQANNLFGIKADPGWTGPTIEMGTQEIVTGGSVAEMATWRRYPSWQACIADHAQFFLVNERYKEALDYQSGAAFAQAIAKAGYATDTQYAAKIIEIIDQYGLEKPMADVTAQTNPAPASSIVTGGVSITVASLVPLVTWALNGFAHPIPETVPYLLAAGLVTLTHLLANVSIQWRKQ